MTGTDVDLGSRSLLVVPLEPTVSKYYLYVYLSMPIAIIYLTRELPTSDISQSVLYVYPAVLSSLISVSIYYIIKTYLPIIIVEVSTYGHFGSMLHFYYYD